ncbi:MAG: carboxylesterase family protein [Pseudomonadota bacterium]
MKKSLETLFAATTLVAAPRLVHTLAVASLTSLSLLGAAGAATVNAPQGQVSGIDGPGYQSFRNIPYALPPVGNLRWKAPVPAGAFVGGTHNGTDPTLKMCKQKAMPAGGTAEITVGAEDCLYLTVTRPAGATASSNLPVFFWIHGGGFAIGTGGLYEGSTLPTDNNMVVVTINYRLGPLGFTALPELGREAANHSTGNYGFLDQVEALKWVKNNIAAFGGNPANVTIAGESAGGVSVMAHLASPMSRGLFHKAVAQSSTQLTIGSILPGYIAVQRANEMTAAMACPASGDAAKLACLRAKSADDITSTGVFSLGSTLANKGLKHAPVVDGVVFPVNPMDAITTGQIAKVPMLIGSNRKEGNAVSATMERAKGAQLVKADVDQALNDFVHGYALDGLVDFSVEAMVYSLFPPITLGNDYGRVLAEASTGFDFACPAAVFRRRLAPQTAVYGYEFEDPNSPPLHATRAGLTGSAHADELQFLFNNGKNVMNGEAMPALSASQQDLAGKMRKYWGNFVRTGNPNGSGLPNWPKVSDAYVNLIPYENRLELFQKLSPSNAGGIATRYKTPINLLDYDFDDTHGCALLDTLMPIARPLAPVMIY